MATNEWSESDFICKLCKKDANEPKLLDCLHFFCKNCINKDLYSYALNKTICCPICDEKTSVPENDLNRLPRATFIEHITNMLTFTSQAKKQQLECRQCTTSPGIATHFCDRCSFICDECKDSHQKHKIYREHKISDIDTVKANIEQYSPRKNEIRCTIHREKITYYCISCKQHVCDKCFTFGDHKDHKYQAVSDQPTEPHYPTLQDTLKRLSGDYTNKLERGMSDIKTMKTEIEDNAIKVKDQIERSLKSWQENMKAELVKLEKQMTEALDKQFQNLKHYQLKIGHAQWMVENCLMTKCDLYITECHDVMLKRLQNLEKEGYELNTMPVTTADISTNTESSDEWMKVMGPQADVNKLEIYGNGSKQAKVSEEAKFKIQTKDANGQVCITHQEIIVQLETPLLRHYLMTEQNLRSETKITAEVRPIESDDGSGVYEVLYTAKGRGMHLLCIQVNGVEIPKSPINVMVHMPPSLIEHELRRITLSHPYQATFTLDDTLLVLEPMTGRVLRLMDNYEQEEFRMEVPRKSHPQGIAAADDGSVYIVYSGSRIVKYDNNGEKKIEITVKGTNSGELVRPGRIKFKQKSGHLYVCDRGNKRVQVFDRNLKFVRVFAEGQQYSDIAFNDDDDFVYLSCKQGNCVYKIAENGSNILPLTIGKEHLKGPRGLLYLNGFLYVTDQESNQIFVFNSKDGYTYETKFSDKNFYDPGSIVADKNGYLYVCDEKEGYISVF